MGRRPVRRYRRMTLRTQVEYEAAGVRRSATATTLGAGGLFVATREPLEAGTPLHVRFRLPGGHSHHALAGRVVWSQPPGGQRPDGCGMGIAFSQPTARLAAELEALARASADAEE